MTVPEETLPALRDGLAQPMLAELDLKAAGITNVIWATGYSFDFSTIKLPVVDGDGFPIQTRGVCAYDGLFFVGLPWLHTAKSGLIYGVGEDASYIADRIAERGLPRKDARAVATQRSAASRANESTAMTRTADRLMTLIWWSALSLVLEGFAHTPSALAQPPRPPALPGRSWCHAEEHAVVARMMALFRGAQVNIYLAKKIRACKWSSQ